MGKLTRPIVVTLALLVLFTLLASAAESDLITSWVRVAPLPQPIAYHRAAAYADTIYVVGGEVPDWTTPVASVLQAKVESDGSVLQWVTPEATLAVSLPVSLPVPLHRHALVQARWDGTDSLYAIGGFSRGNRYAEVWRADLVSSQSHTTVQLRGWQELRNYPRKIILHEAVYANGYIYVLGGVGEDDRPLKEVYSAKIRSDGDLEPWRVQRELPRTLYRFSSAHYVVNCNRHYLYVTGGYDGEQVRRNVYVTEIDQGGTLKKWQDVESLPRALTYHQAIVYGNRLVVIGGSGSDGSYNEVYSAFINADGTLEGWVTEADLPASIDRFSAVSVAVPNRPPSTLYVLGGRNGNDLQSQVYYSEPLPALVAPSIPNSNLLYLPFIHSC